METNINANVGTSLETTHTLDFSDRLYKVAIAFIAVLGVAAAGYVFYQFGALSQNAPHEINVSGEGKAYIKPDIAMVSFGVHTQKMKSQDAVNNNNEIMNAVIKSMKDLGIDGKDIQTTLYSLNPVYDYPRILYPAGSDGSGKMSAPSYVSGGRVFSGYSLDQQISVKIRDFDKISDILDKATLNGANTVGNLQFTIDNPEKVMAEARAKAIEQAKEKLKNIAKQSGLKVGKLVNISEGYNNYPRPMYAEAGGIIKDSGSVAPTIETGQQEVNSTVTLTYQVK